MRKLGYFTLAIVLALSFAVIAIPAATTAGAQNITFKVDVSVDPFGTGTVTLDPDQIAYQTGTTVTLTATPAEDYLFDHWSGDLSGTDPSATIEIDWNKAITAHFIPDPTLLPTDEMGTTTADFTLTAECQDCSGTIQIPAGTTVLDGEGNPVENITVSTPETVPGAPASEQILGACQFGPEGTTFDPSVTVTMSYNPFDLPEGVTAWDLTLAYYDDGAGEWVELEDVIIDTQKMTVSGNTSHLSTVAVMTSTSAVLVIGECDGSVIIPAGTIALDAEGEPLSGITIGSPDTFPPLPSDSTPLSMCQFGPEGATFDPAVTLEIPYDDADVPAGATEEDLVLAYYDSYTGMWMELEDIAVDTENNLVTGSISHFTIVAVLTQTPGIPIFGTCQGSVIIPPGTSCLDMAGNPLESILIQAPDIAPPTPPEIPVLSMCEFGPPGANFDPAITIEMPYDPANLPAGVEEQGLVLAYYDADTGDWVTLDDIAVDTENNLVTGSISHFTVIALLAQEFVPPPTPPETPECTTYYWFDDTTDVCGQKEFCGSFMYEGLQVFDTLDDCQDALAAQEPAECTTYYWFDDTTDVCGQKEFCGSFMYEGLQVFDTLNDCQDTLAAQGPAEPTPTPTEEPPPAPSPTMDGEEDDDDDFSAWVIIGPILGVIFIGLLAYFLVRRRSSMA